MKAVNEILSNSDEFAFVKELMPGIEGDWRVFKIGTCTGSWRATELFYDILAVINEKPGNGHFKDVLEWFENSCKRDNKMLRILCVWNKNLYGHLITKRGFAPVPGTEDVIKVF